MYAILNVSGLRDKFSPLEKLVLTVGCIGVRVFMPLEFTPL